MNNKTTPRNKFSRNFKAPVNKEAVIKEKPAFAREGVAIAGEIQNAVSTMAPSDFGAWVKQEFGAPLDYVTYQTAKTLISTYVESKLKIRHGVHFIERRGQLLLQIYWVKNTPLTITPAEWMVEEISLYERPVWNIKFSDLIQLPND